MFSDLTQLFDKNLCLILPNMLPNNFVIPTRECNINKIFCKFNKIDQTKALAHWSKQVWPDEQKCSSPNQNICWDKPNNFLIKIFGWFYLTCCQIILLIQPKNVTSTKYFVNLTKLIKQKLWSTGANKFGQINKTLVHRTKIFVEINQTISFNQLKFSSRWSKHL